MTTTAILMTARTSAAASRGFTLTQASAGQFATVQVIGLAGTEKAYLQMENFATGEYVNVKYNGSDVYCDVGNNYISVGDNLKYRINKDISAGAVGVNVISDKEIQTYN